MFGGGDCFGAQYRNALIFCQLRHSVPNEPHRRNQDRIRQIQESAPEFSSTFTGPTSGEGSTSGTHDAPAGTHVLQVCGGKCVRRSEPTKLAPPLTGEDIAQKMTVEDDATHVVASMERLQGMECDAISQGRVAEVGTDVV